MTITRGSLNIKLVEKSLLDLFTDDVFQSVDRSHGKDSVNPRTLLRQLKRFQRTMTKPISVMTETSLQTSHEALLGYREARDLMKEARVARGFHPVVVPIRSDKFTFRKR